jgi:L-lactate dehydrogenase complex protein LldG
MSRNKILSTIRSYSASVKKIEHPGVYSTMGVSQSWVFAEQIKKVGGFIFSFDEGQNAIDNLTKQFGQMNSIYSYKETDFVKTNTTLSFQTPPHQCKDLDILIIKAELAVIENGAIWVTEPIDLPRSALFLTQHLIVVVDPTTMVNDMHAAYQKINKLTSNFGVFISGPSKTADVEQCLVIGAHGPRSLTILIEDK